MGRPPIHAAPMSKREIDARHRKTAAQEIAALREMVVEAVSKWERGLGPSQVLAFRQKHAVMLQRAYAAAAQRKE